MAIPFLAGFLLDAWHVPLRHQSYPLGLDHLTIQHLASTAGAASCPAHA